MTKTFTPSNSEILADQIIEGMREKKGQEIVKVDLRHITNSITDFFIICHAGSNRQVDAIADSVLDTVRQELGDKPNTIEGKANSEWILMDYVDVVVHVFQKGLRDHYALEELWADAPIEQFSE